MKITLLCPENDILINMQQKDNFPITTKFIKCKISLIDIEGVVTKSKTESFLFTSKDDQWQFPSFITKGDIQDEKNNFLKNELFILHFEFSVSYGKIEETIDGVANYKFPSVEYFYATDSISAMEDYFLNFDVHLKTGELIFPAHKVVLAAKSPVFCAILNAEVRKNQLSVINIEDLDSETLKYFLKFMYTDALDEIDYGTVSKLLVAADKYEVRALKEQCCGRLMSVISLENVCDTLVVADMINHKHLKAYAIDYIKNHSKEILNSPEWCQWIEMNTKLGMEILREISAHVSG